MKCSRCNRWLKLIAWLLVIVIIIMLLIPAELTFAQLNQIKVGMTLQDAERLLGESDQRQFTTSIMPGSDGKSEELEWLWTIHGEMWKPSLVASITYKAQLRSHPASFWAGKTHLLFIHTDENDVIENICIVPLLRYDGGIRGCFDSIKRYWNKWR